MSGSFVRRGCLSTLAALGIGSLTLVASQVSAPTVHVPTAADSIAVQLDRYRANPAAAPPPRLDVRPLQAFYGQLKSAASAWIDAKGPAEEPQRQLAVATYVLDLINAQDETAWSSQSLFQVSDLIDWASAILRAAPLPAEHDWYIAAAAILERLDGETRAGGRVLAAADARNPLVRVFNHAEDRFPRDPRWQLGYAIAADLQTFPDSHNGHLALSLRDDGPSVDGTTLAAITKRFANAAAMPAVSQEVELRWGYFELRLGRQAEALAHFRAVGDPADVFLRFWLHLFEGRAFEETHAPDDAVAAYRLAVEAVPNAQSGTVALAAALVADHHTTEAVPLVNAMLETPGPLDPWVWYICPDCRAWPQAIGNLRKAVAP